MSNPASEHYQRKDGLLVDGDVCPVCNGDGYIEMGDRDTEWGTEAWAADCVCVGGNPELLPEYWCTKHGEWITSEKVGRRESVGLAICKTCLGGN